MWPHLFSVISCFSGLRHSRFDEEKTEIKKINKIIGFIKFRPHCQQSRPPSALNKTVNVIKVDLSQRQYHHTDRLKIDFTLVIVRCVTTSDVFGFVSVTLITRPPTKSDYHQRFLKDTENLLFHKSFFCKGYR